MSDTEVGSSRVLCVSCFEHYLRDQVVEGWRVGVQAIQVRVKREVRERLPRRLVRLHFQGSHADRALVSHGAAGDHGDPVHAAEAQLTPVLERKALRSIRSFAKREKERKGKVSERGGTLTLLQSIRFAILEN